MSSSTYMCTAAVAAVVVLAACASDAPTGARPPEPVTVALLGLPDTLAAGDIVPVQVQVLDTSGHDVPGAHPTLTSSDPAVALVDGAGRVRAVSVGATTIRASIDGVAGSAGLVVTPGPAVFVLRQFGGGDVPLLLEGDSVMLSDGTSEYQELYLESGALALNGGANPDYMLTLRYRAYAVTRDDSGQRHLTLRSVHNADDRGFVGYDARGDLTLTSELPSLIERASAEAGGIKLLYRFSASDPVPTESFFVRHQP